MVNSKGNCITTVRSEAERVIDHNLPVCRRPLTGVMGVQQLHYRALLLGSQPVACRV